jgi:hypothetical protein
MTLRSFFDKMATRIKERCDRFPDLPGLMQSPPATALTFSFFN